MASKIPFVLGLGAGYLLGTRAGREHYDRIKTTVGKVAENPAVKERTQAAQARVQDAVRQQGEIVTDKVAEAVKERLFGQPAPVQNTAPVDVGQAEVRPSN